MTEYGQDNTNNIGVIFLYQSCFSKEIEFNFISKSSTFFLKDPLINEIYQTFSNDTHGKGLFNSIKEGYSYSHKFIRENCPLLLLKIKTFSWSHDIFWFLYSSLINKKCNRILTLRAYKVLNQEIQSHFCLLLLLFEIDL